MCMVRKSAVQIRRTRLCVLRNVMQCRVCMRAYVCGRVCVYVCVSLHCMNEIVI